MYINIKCTYIFILCDHRILFFGHNVLIFWSFLATHSSPAGPNFNLSCKKDKYILSPAISLEVLTLEKRYYTR